MTRTYILSAILLLSSALFAQRPELVVQSGHLSEINAIAFSPDGQLMATCGDDKTIKLWDMETGKLVRSITTNSEMHDVWFSPLTNESPTSRTVIAAGIEDSIFSYIQHKVHNGRETLNSRDMGLNVRGLAFSVKYGMVAFSTDSFVYASDTARGAVPFVLTQDASAYGLSRLRWGAVDFANHSKLLAAATYSWGGNQFVIWNLAGDSAKVQVEIPIKWEALDLEFSADDRYLFFEAQRLGNHAVGVIDVDSGKIIETWFGKQFVYSKANNDLLFWQYDSDTGEHVVVVPAGQERPGSLQVFDLDSMHFKPSWHFELGKPRSVAVTTDGEQFALTWGTTVYFDNYRTGEVEQEMFGESQFTSDIRFSPQGDKILFNSTGGYLNIWDARSGDLRRLLAHDNYISKMDLDTAGKYLATAGYDSMLVMWDLEGDSALWKAKQPTNVFYSLSFSPELAVYDPPTPHVMVVHGDPVQTMSFYQAGTGEYLSDLTQEIGAGGWAAAYGPYGRYLIVATFENDTMLVIDLNHPDSMAITAGGQFNTIVFDPTENFVAAGGSDTIFLWHTLTGDLLAKLYYPGRAVNDLAFSDSSNLLAAGHDNGSIRIWDLVSGSYTDIKTGQNDIQGLDFSNDGRYVVSSSLDGTVQLSELSSGRKVANIYTFWDGSWAVVDSAGRYDAEDGTNIPQLHYRVNLDTMPYEYEFIELKQLSSRYWDPDLLQEHLGFTNAPLKDVESLGEIAMYPKISLDGSTDSLLRIHLTNRGGGIGKLRLSINQKEIEHDLVVDNPDTAEIQFAYNLHLHRWLIPDSTNLVSVSVFNDGLLESSPHTMEVQAAGLDSCEEEYCDPRLFAIVVGVSDYDGEEIDLQFASTDADSFAKTLKLGASGVFDRPEQVQIFELSTNLDRAYWPTKANIKEVFERIVPLARTQDLLVIYFSGHGVEHEGGWHFLTADASSLELGNEEVRRQETISGEELVSWIKRIPRSNQALILDACAAGSFLDQLSSSKNVSPEAQRHFTEELRNNQSFYVLAGTTAGGESHESRLYGMGLLTYSLLESLQNGRGTDDRNLAYVDEMFKYAEEAVPQYAERLREIQVPTRLGPTGGQSFAIGFFPETVSLPIPNKKPLFSRSRFRSERRLDYLQLEDKVNEHLRRQMRTPARPFMLIEDKDLPEAFLIDGDYKPKGGSIVAEVWVFKGDTELLRLKFKADDADQLALDIVKGVAGELQKLGQL